METVSGLQYSCGNEDSASELAALDVAGRRVLSVAAAGERAFALLLGDPREVVAIDRNPAQVHLGQLKAAAIQRLDRDAYLSFVGIRGKSDRGATYRALRGDLPDDARCYWDGRPGDIAEGIHAVGRTERGIARVAPLLRRVAAADVARLRAADSLAAQEAIAGRLFRRPLVRAALAAIFNPVSGRLLLRDPVYYGEARRNAPEYLRERVTTTLAHHRFDDCFILSLFLNGHLRNSASLPIELDQDAYAIMQQRMPRLTFVRSCILDYLNQQPAASFDAFSLSDLGGYLTVDEFSVLLERVDRAGGAGATVCIREYISSPTTRARWPASLQRRPELERELLRTDRSVGCTFVCAAKPLSPVH